MNLANWSKLTCHETRPRWVDRVAALLLLVICWRGLYLAAYGAYVVALAACDAITAICAGFGS